VDDIPAAARFSDAYAPEHLELHLADAEQAAERFTSAGAVFVGDQTPVSLGDYMAGSNHVLPTGGQARYASGLGSYTFLRPQQVIRYDQAGLAAVRAGIRALSDAEQLPAHGDAVDRRFD
jgi:histidinol dehydrogenase